MLHFDSSSVIYCSLIFPSTINFLMNFFIIKKSKFNKWYYGTRLTKIYALVKNKMGRRQKSGIHEMRMVKLMLKMVIIDHIASICKSNTPKKSAYLLALHMLSSCMKKLKEKIKAFCIFGKSIIINQRLQIQD